MADFNNNPCDTSEGRREGKKRDLYIYIYMYMYTHCFNRLAGSLLNVMGLES